MGELAMISWKDTLSIIGRLFEIHDQDIARRLGVSKQTFSKVKNGAQAPPVQFTLDHVYKKIFDPCTSGSAASDESIKKVSDTSNKEKVKNFWISVLKSIIKHEFTNVLSAMNDCWDEKDYEKFVNILLSRTRYEARPKKIKPTTKGAQIHVEDKYRCCRFCLRWQGAVSEDLDICSKYKEDRAAVDGKDCRYFKLNESRASIDIMAGGLRGIMKSKK